MKPFDRLTHRGQQRRLRSLAQRALTRYDLPPHTIHSLLHRENTTFRLDLDTGERRVLRISKPGADLAAVRSEALWLQSLHHHTPLVVPKPVLDRDGEFASAISIESIPQPRVCCLFRWVEGRFYRPPALGLQTLARLGRFMAVLHNHAQTFTLMTALHGHAQIFTPQAGFTRPVMDIEGLLGGAHGGSLFDLKAAVSRDDRKFLDAALDRIIDARQHIGERPSTIGLTHGDFHAGNFLFHRGEVRAIDFDACSFDFFLSDIAAATRMLDHPRYDEATVLHHFLTGYRSIRLLSPDHERHIDTFKAANNLMLAIWITSRRDNPLIQSYASDFIEKQLSQMKDHLHNTPSIVKR